MTSRSSQVNQCQKPAGWLGRFILWNMNSRHSKVTDWGLSHISIEKRDTILDVGCFGLATAARKRLVPRAAEIPAL